MHLDWTTLALQTINVLILCWLLYRFLYRPILGAMDARRNLIEGQLTDAAAARDKARAELAALEAERRDIGAERDTILSAAAARADALAKERITEAARQVAAMIDQARRSAAAEQAAALAEAKQATLDLATAMASRLLAAAPSGIRAAAWIELIEHHLTALPDTERRTLIGQLGTAARLQATTAGTLSAEAQADWQKRLSMGLGMTVSVDFAVDPTLLGGAELIFPGAVLRFSWKDALAGLRAELEKDDASIR